MDLSRNQKESLGTEIVTLEGKSTLAIELWTQDDVTYFKLDEVKMTSNQYLLNPTSISMEQDIRLEYSFVQFKNNEELTTDLSMVKELIDNYDKVTSGLANDLERYKIVYMY